MKRLGKIKIILPALLFAALLVMNGRMTMKNTDANISLGQLAVSNAAYSEYWYPCGDYWTCVYVYEEQCCIPDNEGSVCYCYCD